VAYAGIDASVKSSGQFEGTKKRMSKRGSPVLRHSLWLAAVSAQRFNSQLKEFYELKRSKGKHSNVATDAVAKRLVYIIYSIWKNNRPFELDYQWHQLIIIKPQKIYVNVKENILLLTIHLMHHYSKC